MYSCFGGLQRRSGYPRHVTRSPIQATLDDVLAGVRELGGGAVADYIPELAEADPDGLALCLATTDGYVYCAGDAAQEFTIQSISKPLTYGLVIDHHGFDEVSSHVGVEPSGEAFNSISLEAESGRPKNPMINAGAITCSGLVPGSSEAERLAFVLDGYGRFAGRELAVDRSVYESEKATGHRNYAIGHLLRGAGMIEGEPEDTLRVYFQQCSVNVTCRDLALIGATLAGGGINPVSSERVLSSETTQTVLSVMTTCGMYDAAGNWVQQIGLPAKSGVAGGILAVLPGQVGIGVWSPKLDQWGNSVRGVEACRQLSQHQAMHFLRVPRTSRSAFRSRHDLRESPSTRLRSDAERAVLDEHGARGQIIALQGDVVFSTVEVVTRKLTERAEELSAAVIDLTAVTRLGRPAAALLLALSRSLAESGAKLAFVTADGGEKLLRPLQAGETPPRLFPDLDGAAQWAEGLLLEQHGGHRAPAVLASPAEHPWLAGLTEPQQQRVTELMQRRDFQAGDLLVKPGRALDEVVLITAGEVSIWIDDPSGRSHRIITAGSGALYGDMSVSGADGFGEYVTAERSGSLYALPAGALQQLRDEDPALHSDLILGLLGAVRRAVHVLSREIATLGS